MKTTLNIFRTDYETHMDLNVRQDTEPVVIIETQINARKPKIS